MDRFFPGYGLDRLLIDGYPGLTQSTRSGVEYWFSYREFEGFHTPFPALFVVSTSLIYLWITYWLARRIAPANRTWMLRMKMAHNIFLFLFSLVCCASTATWMYLNGEIDMGKGLKPMLCQPIPLWMWYLNIAFVFSKIYEWMDTVFLVWTNPEKPRLIFLHVYHHATTFWLFLFVSCFASTIKMGLLLNGGVHTLMYAHYAWPFPKPLVPLITVAQMAQLAFVTYVWTITPGSCGGRLADYPSENPIDFATPYAFVPVYLIFFMKFFFGRFCGQGGHKKSRKADEAGTKKERVD